MNDIFQPFVEIIKVEVRPTLYSKIEERIKEKKKLIPMFWVRTAAAIFICLFSFETYLVIKNKMQQELSELIPESQNHLYDE